MLVFLFLLFFFYVGWGVSFSSFLYTFSLGNVPGMNLSKESAVYLTTVLYFAIVIGQFAAVFMSRLLSPSGWCVKDEFVVYGFEKRRYAIKKKLIIHCMQLFVVLKLFCTVLMSQQQ